jgi:hypothetical protein
VPPETAISRFSGPETPSTGLVAEAIFRWLGGGDAFPRLSPLSRAISFFLTESHAPFRARCSVYAGAPRRQAKVCLRPLSAYGEDRASRPPPLQHRVLIRASVSAGVGLVRIAPGPFRSQVEPPWGRDESRPDDGSVSASRHPGQTYEPLCVDSICRRSSGSESRSVRNPWSVQVGPEPPGRHPILPQAPTSVGVTRHRGAFR